MAIEIKYSEFGRAYVEVAFSRGEHAGQIVRVDGGRQKLSILQAGFVSIGEEWEDELPPAIVPDNPALGIPPGLLAGGFTDDPAILNAALELWDAETYPGASRVHWLTGEPL